jgi:membrane protease YdiL (CAAX protease family)
VEVKTPVRFLAIGEASLALIGLSWAWLRSLAVPYRIDAVAVTEAVLAAAGFTVFNLSLYRLSKRWGRPASLHAFLDNEVFPLFRSLSAGELVLLVSLAGLGEEILFRGALQQEIGLWGASLIFGVMHGPARALWVLAVWATLMGVALGLLFQVSGNLVVPVLAHALYDGAALVYVRRLKDSRLPDPEMDTEVVREKHG